MQRICCASAVARNPGRKAHEIGLSTAARLAPAAQRSERFGTKLHRWEPKSPEKVPEFSRRSLTVHSCRRSVAGARHEPLSRSPLPVLALRFPVPRSSVLRQGENTRIAVIAVLGCLVAWPPVGEPINILQSATFAGRRRPRFRSQARGYLGGGAGLGEAGRRQYRDEHARRRNRRRRRGESSRAAVVPVAAPSSRLDRALPN